MIRRKIAAANWKMNTNLQEGIDLYKKLCGLTLADDVDIVICAPATHLYALSQIAGPEQVVLGAQNMSNEESGAFTGEVSGRMLTSIGVTYVVIGHSERRAYFAESDELLGLKLKTAFSHNLVPIFCCGEALDIRKNGTHVSHVISQIKGSFKNLSPDEVEKIVIAYEPIWAIGTGETASPEQAQEMHSEIRKHLTEAYGSTISNVVPILYGGSVKPANAREIFSKPDVDGGLVGGASLNADSFSAIINSFN